MDRADQLLEKLTAMTLQELTAICRDCVTKIDACTATQADLKLYTVALALIDVRLAEIRLQHAWGRVSIAVLDWGGSVDSKQ